MPFHHHFSSMNRPSYSPFFAISLYLLYDHRGYYTTKSDFFGNLFKRFAKLPHPCHCLHSSPCHCRTRPPVTSWSLTIRSGMVRLLPLTNTSEAGVHVSLPFIVVPVTTTNPVLVCCQFSSSLPHC